MSKQKPPVKKTASNIVSAVPGQPKKAPVKKPKIYILLSLTAVLVLTFVSYFPSLSGSLTNCDDNGYLTENPILAKDKAVDYFTKDKFVMGNYHPLTMISYSLEYNASKLNPKPYHVDNLILHLLNVALVFIFIFLITGYWQAAAIVSALFGVHPMHVESVAWASERKDVLYTFFYLASLIVYIFYTRNKKSLLYIGTLLLFILSLLSKGQAVTLPLSMLLVDYFCNRKFTAKAMVEKIPFFILSVAFGFIAIVAQHSAKTITTDAAFGINSFLYPFYRLTHYILNSILPLHLSCYYPYPDEQAGALPLLYYLAPLIVIGLLSLVYIKFRKNKSIVLGTLFFLLNIGPLLQFLPVGGSITPDRYTYIPYIGLFFIMAQVVMYFCGFSINEGLKPQKKQNKPTPFKNMAIGLVVLVISGFAYAGNQRCRIWKDSETLWTDVIQNYPSAGRVYFYLGYVYYNESKDLTVQKNPEAASPLMEKAKDNFKKSCEMVPDFFDALSNLGISYTSLGKYDSAVMYLSKAIHLQPQNSLERENRSIAYLRLGRYDSALADANHAIAITPLNASYYNNRANIYLSNGIYRNALNDYKTAVTGDSNAAFDYKNMGHCYNKLMMYDSAIFYYTKSLALDPQNQETYMARAFAYTKKMVYNEAIKDYSAVISMNTANGHVYALRSEAFFAIHNKKSALDDALKARQLGFHIDDDYLKELEK